MTDERPRPQYGEYATPEEQVSAGGVPTVRPSPASQPLAAQPTPPRVDSAPNQGSAPAGGQGGAPAGAPLVRRPWDVSLTVFLLSLNAFMVLTSIPDWLNLGTTMTTAYTQLGYGDYTSTTMADSIGLGIVAVQVALLAAVLYLAITRLRAGRRAFPITLGVGLLAVVLTMVLLMIAMTADPALAAYIATQGGN